MDILELVTNTLESLNVPCIYGWYDEQLNTHITFLEFDNVDDNYSDDEAETEEHYLQVDIWTKDVKESQVLKKQVKELLKSNEFIYQDGSDLKETLEDGSVLWHIAQRYFIEEDLI